MRKKPLKIKSLSTLESVKTVDKAAEIIDKWVNEKDEPKPVTLTEEKNTAVQETRFTVVIPTYLHRRIKKYCVTHSISMKTKLVELFEEHFPET